jgi:hypothetical protein
MIKFYTIFFIVFAVCAISCKKSDNQPITDPGNPAIDQPDSNGFLYQNTWYKTPFGILEIWGENNAKSADFDLRFTNGTYQYPSIINEDSVLVYLDMNSPEITNLSEGKYFIQSSQERTPNSIVEAYILLKDERATIKLPILGGEVEVKREGFLFLISYDLTTFISENKETIEVHIKGQYSGKFDIYDMTTGL